MLISLIFMAVWRGDDGAVQIPTWWGAGGLVILFGWWGRFLAVKYPTKQRLIYAATAATCLLMAVASLAN